MKHDNSINGFHITCFSLLFFFLRGGKSQHGVFCLSHFSLFLPGAISCSRELRVLLQHLHGSRQGTGELGVVFVDLVEGWVRTALLAFFFRFLLDWRGRGYSGSDGQGPGFLCIGRIPSRRVDSNLPSSRTTVSSRRRRERETRDRGGRGMRKWGMIPMQNAAGDQGPWAEEADRRAGGRAFVPSASSYGSATKAVI